MRMHKRNYHRPSSAFTIVELLIVIVVIAILAAITIVAFNGIQDRARASAAAQSSSQAAKKVKVWQVDNEAITPTCSKFYELVTGTTSGAPTDPTPPATGPCAFTYKDTSYQYASYTAGSYCATATVGNKSYKVTESTGQAGVGCPGHGVGGTAAITNLAVNPSSETVAFALNTGGGSTAVRTSADKYHGTYSTLLTKSGSYAYVRSNSNNVTPGDVITTCAWVKTSITNVRMSTRGTGITFTSTYPSVTPNTWSRICHTYTIPSGASTFYEDIGWEAANVPDGTTLYVDAIMVTNGPDTYNYADGSSMDWTWNGTANGATSTGPPV